MSSLAGVHNIIADQGATFSYGFVKKDSEKRVVPLTGYTARMQIRETTTSPSTLLSLTTENGYIEIDPPQGAVIIRVPATIMEGLYPNKYVYDLEIINSDGNVERLVMGTFTIRAEVTR